MHCDKCRWFVEDNKRYISGGECHFNPPIVYVANAGTPDAATRRPYGR